MSAFLPISSEDLAAKRRTQNILLIDIRTMDEFSREHIEGAVCRPVTSWAPNDLSSIEHDVIVLMCRSGARTHNHCRNLDVPIGASTYTLEGGLLAWKAAGFEVLKNPQAPLEINRQVQVVAGSLVLGGVLLSQFIHPYFIGLAAFVGTGLIFAGLSGWCGMAKILKVLPWNT